MIRFSGQLVFQSEKHLIHIHGEKDQLQVLISDWNAFYELMKILRTLHFPVFRLTSKTRGVDQAINVKIEGSAIFSVWKGEIRDLSFLNRIKIWGLFVRLRFS